MKIMTTFQSLGTPTSSGATTGFPVTNITDLDPNKRWLSAYYPGEDVWTLVDFGSAKVLTAIFLNQCNFPQCVIQGNASNVWSSPSFNYLANLIKDDASNRKGWFDLSAFNYRYLRILITASQPLDNSETVQAIGNLIAGSSVSLPIVGELTPHLTQRFNRFESDGGNLTKTKKGRAKHTIGIGIGDSLANIRAMDKTWNIGVLYADMGNAGESWLVYPPEDWNKPIKNILDSQLSFTVEERP